MDLKNILKRARHRRQLKRELRILSSDYVHQMFYDSNRPWLMTQQDEVTQSERLRRMKEIEEELRDA